MSARIGKQLQIITSNKIGMLAEITRIITDASVNIDAICAYAMNNKAYFLVITRDNARAMAALKFNKIKVKEEKVVLVELENKVGAVEDMSEKLRDAKIDLSYVYGTTCGCGDPSLLVFKSNKDSKAVEVLQ